MSSYLHGHHESVLRSHRSRTAANSAGYLVPHLASEMTLLDVGSGPGTITCDLAALVDEVVALEQTADALRLTTSEVESRGVANVRGEVGDVHHLPFPDATFDVTHAHMVLQHVADPVQALREMARVTKPGGLIAARDSDYGMFTWLPASAEISEWLDLYHAVARASGGEPDAGRYYHQWAAAAGLSDVTFGSTSWVYASDSERMWWANVWADRLVNPKFIADAAHQGVADTTLRKLAAGFLNWAKAPAGLFLVPSVELLARA